MNNHKYIISKLFSFLIIIVIFFFLGKQFYKNWGQLSQYQWQINGFIMVVSFMVIFLVYILVAFGLKLTLYFLGKRISVQDSFRINYLSNIGKYVPGNIWSIAGYVYIADKMGFSKKTMLISKILFAIIQTIAGCVLLIVINLFFPEVISSFLFNRIITIVFIVLLTLPLLYPVILERIVNFFLIKMAKKKISLRFKKSNLLVLMLLSTVIWISYGMWFWIFIRAIYPVPIINLVAFIAIFFLSWFSGFLVFVVPGGLGVREGVMTILLKPLMPLPVAIVIPLLLRIATIIADLLSFTIALSLKNKTHKLS